MKSRDRALSGRGASVQEDWCAWLSREKSALFHMYQQQLAAAYHMLSVSLNEALELNKAGYVSKSYQAVCVTPALCSRLVQPLSALLRALAEHAKHYGTVPNAASLNPANFLGSKGQRAARRNALLNHVLLSHRAQFLQKISALDDLIQELGNEFGQAAAQLSEGFSPHTDSLWAALDTGHYDLNTCLREAEVLLKSFLVALPEDQLPALEKSVRDHMQTPASGSSNRQPLLRDRRLAHFAGE